MEMPILSACSRAEVNDFNSSTVVRRASDLLLRGLGAFVQLLLRLLDRPQDVEVLLLEPDSLEASLPAVQPA